MSKISCVYFSPSGTTKKVAEEIAKNFEGENAIYDLLVYPKSKQEVTFTSEDTVIVAMPVFAGRIPKTAREKLEYFKGNDTPAIAVVNYGNAHVTDSLLELKELLEENGFKIAGLASIISQHSIFTKVAAGRPDYEDLEKIKEFSEKCIAKINANEFNPIEVPGNKPYVEYKDLPFVPTCDETLCVFCYDCVSICPENCIPDDDPVMTETDKCSSCTACIHICPENARAFRGDAFEEKDKSFTEINSERKEPEFYL